MRAVKLGAQGKAKADQDPDTQEPTTYLKRRRESKKKVEWSGVE